MRIVDLAADMIRLSGLEIGKDINIEFIGQRAGEKLFEELHCDGERHLATSHPKIMVAESQRVELMSLPRSLARLEDLAEGPNDAVRNTLKQIVPEFCPEAGEFPSRRAA